MTEAKGKTSRGKITTVLAFRKSTSAPTIPNILHVGSHTDDHFRGKNKTGKKVSPMMISSLKKGLKSFGKKKQEQAPSLLLASTTSSITFTDFEDFSSLEKKGDGAMPPLTSLQRGVSLNSDAKSLRPLRRASIESDYLRYDSKVPSKPMDLSMNDNSSVTYSAISADDSQANRPPPPPAFARALSVDSDWKPLRPLRRDSGFTGQLGYFSIDEPEPGKKTHCMDSLPHFPSRKCSMDVSHSVVSEGSMDGPNSNVPSRSTIGRIPHVRRRHADRQPCVPGRRASLTHCKLLEEDEDLPETEALQDTNIPFTPATGTGLATPSA